MLRVCVSGCDLVADEAFVGGLRAQYGVTLVPDHDMLIAPGALDTVDALVLDSRGALTGAEPLVRRILRQQPTLPIVLINGGLTEQEKVEAFSLGVQDYFREPCLVGLLVERLEVLARGRVTANSIALGE